VRPPLSRLSRHFASFAVQTRPSRPKRDDSGSFTFLIAYLRPYWRRVLVLAATLIAGTALALVGPQILRVFIDGATSGASLDALLRLAGAYLAVAVAGQGVAVAETYVAENLGQAATNDLRADLTRHCLDLDLGFHQLRTPGELIERVDGDVANLANFFSRFVVQIVGNALLLVGVLALLYGVTLPIGLGLTVCALVTIAVLFRLRFAGVPSWVAARQASAELFGFLEERLGGTEDLRSSGAVEHTLRRFAERSHGLYRAERGRAVVASATSFSANLFFNLTTVVGLALGAAASVRGEISIGAVYLVYSYTQLLSRPLDQLARQVQDLQRAVASLERIRDLLATPSRLVATGRASLPRGPLAVELDDVTFGYAADEPVLRGVSLAFGPGEVVGLLGRTGSGKTTLARLVARFYDPDRGGVRVGGVDLRDAAPGEVRRGIAVVTQEVHLFHASVRDNLTMFDRSIPDERIVAALRELGIGDWCQALPGGLAARLAPGSLSAGEAQLVAFARVFLRDPGLVILDEASSRLDPATERQIERALDRLLVGRTAIVIAHRLSTVERADTVVILEDGAVVERGPRANLARNPDSRFARLRRAGLEEVLA
jgi:ABC-type multidrug transport system fused ATPase/permease subunit